MKFKVGDQVRHLLNSSYTRGAITEICESDHTIAVQWEGLIGNTWHVPGNIQIVEEKTVNPRKFQVGDRVLSIHSCGTYGEGTIVESLPGRLDAFVKWACNHSPSWHSINDLCLIEPQQPFSVGYTSASDLAALIEPKPHNVHRVDELVTAAERVAEAEDSVALVEARLNHFKKMVEEVTQELTKYRGALTDERCKLCDVAKKFKK